MYITSTSFFFAKKKVALGISFSELRRSWELSFGQLERYKFCFLNFWKSDVDFVRFWTLTFFQISKNHENFDIF